MHSLQIASFWSQFAYFATTEGTGNLEFRNTLAPKGTMFKFEPYKGNYRIVNIESGYYVHAESNGTGNVRMEKSADDKCQTFIAVRGSKIGRYYIQNVESGYYIAGEHGHDSGNIIMSVKSNPNIHEVALEWHQLPYLKNAFTSYRPIFGIFTDENTSYKKGSVYQYGICTESRDDFVNISITQNGGASINIDSGFTVSFSHTDSTGTYNIPVNDASVLPLKVGDAYLTGIGLEGGKSGLLSLYATGKVNGTWTINFDNTRGSAFAILFQAGSSATYKSQFQKLYDSSLTSTQDWLDSILIGGEVHKRDSSYPGACFMCQTEWFLIGSILGIVTTAEFITTAAQIANVKKIIGALTATAPIIKSISLATGADASAVLNALQTIATYGNPLYWPSIYCQYIGMCR